MMCFNIAEDILWATLFGSSADKGLRSNGNGIFNEYKNLDVVDVRENVDPERLIG